MQNTKLIYFLKSLSRSELRDFDKFVRSPFFNSRKDVVRFFEVIKKYYPDFNVKKAVVYKKLYPGKEYKPEVIVLLNAYLYKIGKEFLVVKNLREEKFFYDFHLLKELDKHNADDLFEKELYSAENFLNNEKMHYDHFFRKSLLEELKGNFAAKRNRQDKGCRSTIDLGNYLVYSFIVNLSILYHDISVNKKSFNYEFSDSSAEYFLTNFNSEKFIENFDTGNAEFNNYISFYYYLLMCYYKEGDEFYSKLKEYSFKDIERLSESEKSGRYNVLSDYCLQQLTSGNIKFLHETFNLHREALEKKLYVINSTDDSMGVMFFRNFVSIGLAAKELDYIEEFINRYSKKIRPDIRNDLFELSCGMLYVERKQFGKALASLQRVTNTFPFFKMATRFALIKVYYETAQYEELFLLLDTYKHYIKKEKFLTEMIKQKHTYFIKNVLMLAKIKSSVKQIDDFRYDLSVIKQELKNNKDMDFRHKLWLIEKADELEANEGFLAAPE